MKQCNANKTITVLGIDLAKQSFQLHGVDVQGETVLRKTLNRDKLVAFIANLSPCLIGLEACGGSHHWVRVFTRMGHTVRMMALQFVKPYVKSNKNDAVDAESLFKTVKYCPQWPVDGFYTIEEARSWIDRFVGWYNTEHKHSGIKYVTPEQRHGGLVSYHFKQT